MQELQERKTADNAGSTMSTPGFRSASNISASSGNSVSSVPSSGMSREWSDSIQLLCSEMSLKLILSGSGNVLNWKSDRMINPVRSVST